MQEVLLKTEVFSLFLTQGQEMTILMVTTWSKKKKREKSEEGSGLWKCVSCTLFTTQGSYFLELKLEE